MSDIGNVTDGDITKEMKVSYLAYASAVIKGRALPDVFDGLKPVHRRALYAMHQLGIGWRSAPKKSARIVGETLGKFHPHGDTSVYDAIVRMAQPFSMRYPLVIGQGNFGSVDGDSAAAMRYTEAKLSVYASYLFEHFDETVEYRPNYDETDVEPDLLPTVVPNLLLNGSEGIAVGMASKIPPHRIDDIVNAVEAYVRNCRITNHALADIVVAPDFPTGGLICGTEGARQAYCTGQGRVVVRARIDVEQVGDTDYIVFTELPYQVNKKDLFEQLSALVKKEVVTFISELRDESDKSGMRGVIKLKRGTNVEVAINQLYKETRLEDGFSINMVCLVNGAPRRATLSDVIGEFVRERRNVIWRRTECRIRNYNRQLKLLAGRLGALENIKEVTDILLNASGYAEAKEQLTSHIYAFSSDDGQVLIDEEQASDIMSMPLSKLVRLERNALYDQYWKLVENIEHESNIISPDSNIHIHDFDSDEEYSHYRFSNLNEELLANLRDATAVINRHDPARGDRMSTIVGGVAAALDEELIEPKDVVVTLTNDGYIKATPLAEYRQQGRGGRGKLAVGTKTEDFIVHHLVVNSHDWVYMFTKLGRVYAARGFALPEGSRTARGKPIVNVLDIGEDDEISALVRITKAERDDPGLRVFMASTLGRVKQVAISAFSTVRDGGKIAVALGEGESLVRVDMTPPGADVILVTELGQAVRLCETEVRVSLRGSGMVRGMGLADNDRLVSMQVCADASAQLLIVSSSGYGKLVQLNEFRTMVNRGGRGVIAATLNDGEKVVATAMVTDMAVDVVIISRNGIVVRIPVKDISIYGRAARGVRLMSLDDGDYVVNAALTESDNDE